MEVSTGDWASEAVRQAIEAMMAAELPTTAATIS